MIKHDQIDSKANDVKSVSRFRSAAGIAGVLGSYAAKINVKAYRDDLDSSEDEEEFIPVGGAAANGGGLVKFDESCGSKLWREVTHHYLSCICCCRCCMHHCSAPLVATGRLHDLWRLSVFGCAREILCFRSAN